MIRVDRENAVQLDAMGFGRLSAIIERCFFCENPTRHWHRPTNQPICQPCAKTHRVSELEPAWRIPESEERK